ncbi:MAG: hypothetical protein ABW185_28645 [Sedimenticola sp.]
MDALSIFERLLGDNAGIFIGIMTGVFSVLIALPMYRILGRRTRIFYSEGTEDSDGEYEDRLKIKHLEREVSKLRKEISSGLLKNASELIDREVSTYLANNLESMTTSKLEDT